MSELNDFNQSVISEFRANHGKVGGQLANMPVLLLTMTGAKSGRALTRPLVYTTDGDRLVVIASFAGAPHNPSWYHNLVANPVATVELGRANAFGSESQLHLVRSASGCSTVKPNRWLFLPSIRKRPPGRYRF